MCRGNHQNYDQIVPNITLPDILEKLNQSAQDELYIRSLLKNCLFSISKENQLICSTIQTPTSVSVIVPNRRKRKSVKFADEYDQPLATVFQYEHPVYKEISSRLIPHWKTTFEQPLSDYANFNQKLLKNMVCLENALILEEPYQIYGTIATNRIEFCIYCNINDKRTFCDNNNDANYVIMLEMKPPDLLPFKKVTRKHKKRHHHNQYVVENLDYINEAWKTYDKGC